MMKPSINPLPYLAFSAVLMLWQAPGLAVEITLSQTTPLATSAPHTLKPTITDTETPLFDRQQWQLSEPEWQRYTTLLQGIRQCQPQIAVTLGSVGYPCRNRPGT